MSALREINFDGLVGLTHNYGGLSPGNVASDRHRMQPSSPREAALQGLGKMRLLAGLGLGQAVLPPQMRPSLVTLRRLGFHGSDEAMLARAWREAEHLVRLCSSAAAMWTANAATCAPSTDTEDGRMHLTPANLQEMFHRAIEAPTTHAVLRRIFASEKHFVVHDPLPGGGQFADEGAANHTRLALPGREAVHLFAWGRRVYADPTPGAAPVRAPARFPARQTLEASQALARLHRLAPDRCLFPQQDPDGIDVGAFHTDVMAVGNEGFLMLHELAFVDHDTLLATLADKLGPDFRHALATSAALPPDVAVAAYPFNSQLVTLPGGEMAVIAPLESQEAPAARAFLESVVAGDNPVARVCYLDVRQSMQNGGGPACLRLRVWLTDEERDAVVGGGANVFFTPELDAALTAWVTRHYRERLSPTDLGDPSLARESMAALDELTRILGLGSVYEFQK